MKRPPIRFHRAVRGMILLAAFMGGCGESPRPPAGRLLDWVRHPLLVEGFYRHPDRMVSDVADSGAVSVNREWEEGTRPGFYIEQQRYGADLIQAGVATGDDALIGRGVRLIDWAFARQGPEGNFPGTGDPMHSTSFLVEAAARSALILDVSGLPQWQAKVADWKPRIHAAARWMVRPEEMMRNPAKDLHPYTHRYYLRGAALAEAGLLCGDPALADAARKYIEEGLAKQQADGVNPEKGGLDIGYQCVGVFYAQLCYLTLADAGLKERLASMMGRALSQPLAAIQQDGSVDVEGSTRADEVGRSGRKKSIPYRTIIPALLFYSEITGDTTYQSQARRVAAHAWKVGTPSH